MLHIRLQKFIFNVRWLGPSHVGGSTECGAIENLIATAFASEDTACTGRVPLITTTVAFDVVVQVLRPVEQAAFLLLALMGLAHFLAMLLAGSVRVFNVCVNIDLDRMLQSLTLITTADDYGANR